MRDNKGFTLIELLAVIVILAIIAVITVPKIAEMIESSRKGAAEDSAYGALKAAELAWAKRLQAKPELGNATCDATDGTCEEPGIENSNFSMQMSGTKPKAGTINLGATGSASSDPEDENDANKLEFNNYLCYGTTEKVTCEKKTGSS